MTCKMVAMFIKLLIVVVQSRHCIGTVFSLVELCVIIIPKLITLHHSLIKGFPYKTIKKK